MSSAHSLREFIRERLTAAAAEIFSEFEQTIVRYEEEIDRQRRLLEISWKPQINLHRIELPLHYGRRDGRFLTDQQLWDKERSCSLDQEQPEPLQDGSEPPHIKVEQDDPEPLQILEQEELCISQDEEQFVLKQETVTSLVTPADEQSDHHEPEPDRHQLLSSLSPAAEIQNQEGRIHHFKLPQHHVWEKEKVLTDQQFSNQETNASLDQKEPEPPLIKEEQQEICIYQQEGQFILKEENLTSLVISPSGDTDCCEPEPNRNQPLCQSSTEVENKEQDGCRNENSESNSNEELTQNKSRQLTEDHRDGVDSQKLKRHKRAHRGKKLFSCKICGKSYSYNCELTVHMIAHTDKKPFTCLTCGKCFSQVGTLNYHTRTHTGEKPFKCWTCGKCFSRSSILTMHLRSHTGEKPFKCETCCKGFSRSSNLTTHMRTHTGEKPFKCKTCGKCFTRSGTLTDHIRTHTGEKPYSCKVCSKSFACRNHLTRHIRIHKVRSHSHERLGTSLITLKLIKD